MGTAARSGSGSGTTGPIDVDAIASEREDTASEYEPGYFTPVPRSPIPIRPAKAEVTHTKPKAKVPWIPNLGSDNDVPDPFARLTEPGHENW